MDVGRSQCCRLQVGNSHPDILVIEPAKKWPEVGIIPSDGLDVSVLGKASTWSDDLVPPSGSKTQQWSGPLCE